ncbi:venom allergen 5-like [Drosophila obscura]|uniref:venom allergen 5-like n=1 Tax=Drosophila obscura TaxID=7282 RepID=UPI001BB1C262|nr:venom allergen 5-like [Drosophila obscura]
MAISMARNYMECGGNMSQSQPSVAMAGTWQGSRSVCLWICIWICLYRCCICESKEFDYCGEDACTEGTGPHLACKHSQKFDSACPADAKLLRIDSSVARYIIREHNVARNQVARGTFHKLPASTRMLTVHWDERLAWLAELSVMKCALERHTCFRSPSYQMPGQNEAYNKFKADQDPLKVLRSQIKAWKDEYLFVDITTILGGNNHAKQDVGHYLQMITASVESLGCAMALYKKDGFTYQITKCIYSCYLDCLPIYPTGHIPGELCRFGVNDAYNALCSVRERLMCDESDCCDLMDPLSTPEDSSQDKGIAARVWHFALEPKAKPRSKKAAKRKAVTKKPKKKKRTTQKKEHKKPESQNEYLAFGGKYP